jgi:hypothetical protein
MGFSAFMTDESLFREVDEEVRQDEYKKLWQRHGKLISTAIAAVVLGVGGYEFYKHYEQQQAEQAAVVYNEALKKAGDGKLDDALAALKAVNHKGVGQLAQLKEADLLAEKGEKEKAVAAYDAFAASAANDPTLVDTAKIKAGYLLVDTSTPDQLLVRLGAYDKDTEIWRHQAREIFGLSAWRIKDYAMADRYMKALVDDLETPQGMRQRAMMMVQLIAPHLPEK